MSLPNAVIDAMLAAGCTAEQLAAAMKAANAADEARREEKRAGNAERQQRFRDARKAEKEAAGTAGNKRNARNALRSVTPPIDNNHTPTPDISSDEESQSQRGDADTVLEIWNATVAPLGLPTAKQFTGNRLKSCKARIREHGLEAIQAAIQRIPKSAFLRGETGNWNGANLTFLFRPDTVTKILEGQYDDRQQPRNCQEFSGRNGHGPDRRSTLARAIDQGLDFLGPC